MKDLLHLGTSGWSYKDWVGNFYPAGLAQGKWLEYYVTQFNTVEVDSTFYAIPPRSRVERWAQIALDGFEKHAIRLPSAQKDCPDNQQYYNYNPTVENF